MSDCDNIKLKWQVIKTDLYKKSDKKKTDVSDGTGLVNAVRAKPKPKISRFFKLKLIYFIMARGSMHQSISLFYCPWAYIA